MMTYPAMTGLSLRYFGTSVPPRGLRHFHHRPCLATTTTSSVGIFDSPAPPDGGGRQLGAGCCQKLLVGRSARRFGVSSLLYSTASGRASSRVEPADDHVISSPYEDLHIPQVANFSCYVMDEFGKRGDRTQAIVDGITGRSISYAELQTMIWRSASALHRLGVRAGDVVTLISENRVEYPIAFLACQTLGAVVCTLNDAYVQRELTFAMKHSHAQFCIASEKCIQVAKESFKELGFDDKRLIVLGRETGLRSFDDLLEDDGSCFPSGGVANVGQRSAEAGVHKDSCVLPYSSGTTGLPKGVMLSHQNIIANITQLKHPEVMQYAEGEDRILGILPWYHIYGQVIVMLAGLKAGATLITMPKFTPESYLKVIETQKPTFLHIVPPIILFMEKSPMLDDCVASFDSVKRVVTAAAPVGGDTMRKMATRCGINDVQQIYGLTETSPITHSNPISDLRHETCGVVVPNTQYKITCVETGKSLPRKVEGEICVKGPQVMLGYLGNENATKEMICDRGWLRTGDIGYADDDGHMVITDRLKELIKFKGHQIAPAELEALLVQHPAVVDAAVIGVPDDRAGELPRAYVVLKQGTRASVEDITKVIDEQVAPHKRLRGGVEFRDSIPKTNSGKILRKQLRAELKQ